MDCVFIRSPKVGLQLPGRLHFAATHNPGLGASLLSMANFRPSGNKVDAIGLNGLYTARIGSNGAKMSLKREGWYAWASDYASIILRIGRVRAKAGT
jgi:hypothetical protein